MYAHLYTWMYLLLSMVKHHRRTLTSTSLYWTAKRRWVKKLKQG
jgi:hypothetical protein